MIRPAHPPLPPGSTIGFLGGGQLAAMMCSEARRLGLRTAVIDPDADAPAARCADRFARAALGDASAVERLASSCDAVTIDTEHVPPEAMAAAARVCRTSPSPSALAQIQDRLEQRRLVGRLGIAQPRFVPVHDDATLRAAADGLQFPAVLKARRGGYDGRSQAVANSAAGLADAWRALGRVPCIAEEFVRFEREVSLVMTRSAEGMCVPYPLAENEHRNHALRLSRVPARTGPAATGAATTGAAAIAAEEIAEALDYAGVLAVEFFVTSGGSLLVNEIAPRVHNSGHWTLGGATVSQFEQHVRAVAGWPLGRPEILFPAAMLNLYGDLWSGGHPDFDAALAEPGARIHLYGKRRAEPGRKMGHVTVLRRDPEDAVRAAERIEAALLAGAAVRSEGAPA
ncbi:MAG: N5-carboxyaminoimidazole ribonucleotide synthase [Planctomycetes bacterium]|nr:N5-carboxyaminoimidazole ribonucleotide synthase [Planctomycetota bacterium]